MASIITLDGPRLGVTNDYGEEIPATPSFDWGSAAQTFVGWGIVAFALGTGFFRAKDALLKHLPRRSTQTAGWSGKRRRR